MKFLLNIFLAITGTLIMFNVVRYAWLGAEVLFGETPMLGAADTTLAWVITFWMLIKLGKKDTVDNDERSR